MTDKLQLKTRGRIAHLILNNPIRRNAIDLDMWRAIPALVKAAEAARVRALILHGGETLHFAAGADISEFPHKWGTHETANAAAQHLQDATSAIERCKLVTIAAIEGTCMGAGLSLAAACDLRIIADGAKIGLPPAKLGACLPYDDIRRLVDIIGAPIVRDLILTARVIDADEAARVGLASRRCARGQAARTAMALAEQISALSSWSQQAAKTQLIALAGGQRSETQKLRALQVEGFLNADFKEGCSAFLVKRKPDFG